jgi:hypothetical protein
MLTRAGVTAVLVAIMAAGCTGQTTPTDPPLMGDGVRLVIDELTGCEYLALQWGGITPRLAPDGRQVCRLRVPK